MKKTEKDNQKPAQTVDLQRFQMRGPEGEMIAQFARARNWAVSDALRFFAIIGAWFVPRIPDAQLSVAAIDFSQEEEK